MKEVVHGQRKSLQSGSGKSSSNTREEFGDLMADEEKRSLGETGNVPKGPRRRKEKNRTIKQGRRTKRLMENQD